ncbi:Chemotaxis protein MotB [Piscirickettsia salmonis]|uniref:flagellar motor protein MotB n=1 Tax=Piscirickettsia salmonis TaxID=1238 RepID=UPI0012BA6B16|nr:flagellar motor protein MotB [Piscirickettsia salmonis]QGP53967.1 Chemotaxis protein MotB [Piscirickettsia salmonis]QGP60136.1 Chemotaxis protein MotB [Piscirickettsia salmonis]QGP63543.1 Chemotaxis protein MotB [Piscirickettsia salmonis]
MSSADDDEPEEECPEGLPPWLATFADLMSLLMCFFVLLLSFSEMDVQKYKRVAGSMKFAFGVQRQIRVEDIPKGTSVIKQEFSPGKPVPTPVKTIQQVTKEKRPELNPADQVQDKTAQKKAKEFETVAKRQLAAETQENKISVKLEDKKVIIRLKEGESFQSGSEWVRPTFLPVIAKIANVLKKTKGNIIVAGHTDNLRISNARFRSNWDLSAARAVSVALALFRDKGLEQKRFMVVGYADTQALEDNKTAANRSKNRRVEITVVFGKDEEGGEFSIDDEEIGLPDDF